MSEIEILQQRIAALEARVHYLETKTVPYWTGPTPQPYLPWVTPLQPILPPFLPNGPYPVTCTDGFGNVTELKGVVTSNVCNIAQ